MIASCFQKPSQMAAYCMRQQMGYGLGALAVTALRIADLNPLAGGIAANFFVLREIFMVKRLPFIAQVLLTGGMITSAYLSVSQLHPHQQAISFVALLVLDMSLIGARDVWKELKV